MSPFSGLSAKIEADAADYNSTVEVAKQLTEELGDEAFEVSAAMQVMASRTDEAEDEASQLARSAGAASAGLGSMGAASVGASNGLNLVSVSAAGLEVSLGPLLVILAAVVAALAGILSAGIAIASLGGLLLGSGLLVFGQRAAARFSEAESAVEGLAKVAKNLQSRIAPILRPLGAAFAPLLQQAVDAVPHLVRSIVSAVGPLQSFRRSAQTIGSAIQRLLPLVIRLGAEAFRELRTELGLAAREFINMLPSLVRLGVNLLEVLLPALTVTMFLLQGLFRIVNRIAELLSTLGGIIITVGTAIYDGLVVPIIQAVKASDKLIGRLTQLVGLLQTLSGSPGGQFVMAAGTAIAASAGGGAAARRSPSTRRPNEARRGNPQGRSDDGLPPIRVEGDTELVKDVSYESGREGARDEIDRERRRTGDRR